MLVEIDDRLLKVINETIKKHKIKDDSTFNATSRLLYKALNSHPHFSRSQSHYNMFRLGSRFVDEHLNK